MKLYYSPSWNYKFFLNSGNKIGNKNKFKLRSERNKMIIDSI